MTRIVIISALLLECAARALAAEPVPVAPAKPQVMHESPCAGDARRFCNDVPYGNGRRLDCLAHHWAQLTPACRPRLKILQAMFAFGQEQHRRTVATLAREAAEAAKQKAAAAKKNAAPPNPQ